MNYPKLNMTTLVLSASIGLATIHPSVHSAELNLADQPLFLGISTDPNVFFELDDSGSMDWEILTVPYYHYCQYDSNAIGSVSSNDCSTALRDDGLWRVYGNYSFRTLAYIFDNDDNAYGGECNGSYPKLESCDTATVLDSDWRGVSSDFNVIYYDPTATYNAWSGTGLADANFSAARSDPQPAIAAIAAQSESATQYAIPAQSARAEPTGYSLTRDLSGFTYSVWIDSHGFDTANGYPRRGTNINRTNVANGVVDLWDNFYQYTVNSSDVTWEKIEWSIDATTGAMTKVVAASGTIAGTATDPNVTPARTADEIRQNVANWYSYARRRSFVAKGAVGAVVSGSPGFRFGQSVINNSYTVFNEVPPAGVTKYTGYNAALLNDLYSYNWPASGTPLRRGLETAGKYLSGRLYGKGNPVIQSCQQNFTVLFTDGYWNGGDPVNPEIEDRDGDGLNKTLADVARYYYDHDLDTSVNNNVVPNDADPATYQHVVTFPVAFGVNGDLVDTDNDGWPNPELTESSTWGSSPYLTDQGKIDDMWHAAYNSKGEYVSAQTPEELLNSLTSALSEITERDAAAASVATSTGQISSSTAVFQAQFNSGDWSGRLFSYSLNADNSVNTSSPNWEASTRLDSQNYNSGRAIISNNGSRGIPFRFPTTYGSLGSSEMNSSQVAELLDNSPYATGTASVLEIAANQTYGQKIVNYLRGDRTYEGTATGYLRPRSSVLGDIVESDPKYVPKPSFFYPDTLESASYAAFRTTYSNRTPMVYVGANDGMLHGFKASNGEELLAYVPSSVYHNLDELADSAYDHKFYVNAAPTVVDSFYGGAWHTVLAGALGRGGQGVFALDVTNPANFNEANANNIFLWEFDDSDDADLGYTYSEPSIAKMANGKWAAVFGNGYNNTEADGNASTTGHAVLYIVDISNGAIIKKIDTLAGTTGTPNGLASPALVDINNDYIVDYIYAGDLQGNMWKFDVSDSATSKWEVAWTQGSTKIPLFTTDTGQPITTRPAIGAHVDQDGLMVFFGTGQYMEVDDNDSAGQPDQSFYGIWDQHEGNANGLPVEKADLLQQEIEHEFSATLEGYTYKIRLTTNNEANWESHEGWYLDLVNRNETPIDNEGERQVSDSLLRNGRIIFPTRLPSSAPCSPGGSSWLMELDAANGSRLNDTPFDLNEDGTFSTDDFDYNVSGILDSPASGIQTDNGVVTTPGILRDGSKEVKYLSGSTGTISDFSESTGSQNIGRQSWRELE
ncbi:pilus assembly protein [Teredinibacter waterburyi]|uniref:pilus assembly protein n=1 Tax=Teredinibacter waterburyi TaxID=1500538 RepID=UPI00165F4107|nr:PilC/PilY family type IV pilus protein [Teredinibacter waterburyi]